MQLFYSFKSPWISSWCFTLLSFCSLLSFTLSPLYELWCFFLFKKVFCDLGLGMNLWLRFIFFSSLAFQLFDWLHVVYIGNRIDSILSLSFEIYLLVVMQHDLHLSLWRDNSYVNIVLLDTCWLLMLGTNCNYVLLNTHCLRDTYTCSALSICLAPEWLDTYYIYDSTPIATRYLYIYHTWHILLAQHELNK